MCRNWKLQEWDVEWIMQLHSITVVWGFFCTFLKEKSFNGTLVPSVLRSRIAEDVEMRITGGWSLTLLLPLPLSSYPFPTFLLYLLGRSWDSNPHLIGHSLCLPNWLLLLFLRVRLGPRHHPPASLACCCCFFWRRNWYAGPGNFTGHPRLPYRLCSSLIFSLTFDWYGT